MNGTSSSSATPPASARSQPQSPSITQSKIPIATISPATPLPSSAAPQPTLWERWSSGWTLDSKIDKTGKTLHETIMQVFQDVIKPGGILDQFKQRVTEEEGGLVTTGVRKGLAVLNESLNYSPAEVFKTTYAALSILEERLRIHQFFTPAEREAAQKGVQNLLQNATSLLGGNDFPEDVKKLLTDFVAADQNLTHEIVSKTLLQLQIYALPGITERTVNVLIQAIKPAVQEAFKPEPGSKPFSARISSALGAVEDEKELAAFVEEFCKSSFAEALPAAPPKDLNPVRKEFIKNTADFLVKDLGSFTRSPLLPWVHWYIEGFTLNAYKKAETLIEEGKTDKYWNLRKAFLTKATELLKSMKDGTITPETFEKTTLKFVEDFAPRFQTKEKTANFFRRLWWPFGGMLSPISWLGQLVGFIIDKISNYISIKVLKYVLLKNQALPILFAETKRAMGIGSEIPHALLETLHERLKEAIELQKQGGASVEFRPTEAMRDLLSKMWKELRSRLDEKAVETASTKQSLLNRGVDILSEDQIKEMAVNQLAALFDYVFSPESLKDQMYNLFVSLNDAVKTDTAPAARRENIERDFYLTLDKIIFLNIFLGIEKDMDPTTFGKREAARMIATVQEKIKGEGERFTLDHLAALENKYIGGIPEGAQRVLKEKLNELKKHLEKVKEATKHTEPLEKESTKIAASFEQAEKQIAFFTKITSPFSSVEEIQTARLLLPQLQLNPETTSSIEGTLSDYSKELQDHMLLEEVDTRLEPLQSEEYINTVLQDLDKRLYSPFSKERIRKDKNNTEALKGSSSMIATYTDSLKKTAEDHLPLLQEQQEQLTREKTEKEAQISKLLQTTVDQRMAIGAWVGANPFQGIPMFNPDTDVGVATRALYSRYQPLVRSAMRTITKEAWIDGVVFNGAIKPYIGP